MGDKGETLAELRHSSGASIRVAEGHETPKCGRSSDRLVTVRHPGCRRSRTHCRLQIAVPDLVLKTNGFLHKECSQYLAVTK